MTELRSKHAKKDEGFNFGIDGNSGKITNMNDVDVWDPIAVKL
jgi:T-complex protein 1 subunit gamma